MHFPIGQRECSCLMRFSWKKQLLVARGNLDVAGTRLLLQEQTPSCKSEEDVLLVSLPLCAECPHIYGSWNLVCRCLICLEFGRCADKGTPKSLPKIQRVSPPHLCPFQLLKYLAPKFELPEHSQREIDYYDLFIHTGERFENSVWCASNNPFPIWALKFTRSHFSSCGT